ncbi:P-loop containing nucleoside triphosphate hydrolase protein [Amylostereum chailletii]|nr:P-loop containing nucleoside triphosphate hydrolase protein [Amylostereum chailletii]
MEEAFLFDSSAGREGLCSILLPPFVPYAPHDDQLTCVSKLLDNVDVLAILPTGSGKTRIFFMFIHVIQVLHEDHSIFPKVNRCRYPVNLAMVIICPTKSLSEEMEASMKQIGLSALAITQDSVSTARLRGEDIWKSAHTSATFLIMSPEQLSSSGFAGLLDSPSFSYCLVRLGANEIHLVDTWGAYFQKVFRQIGLMHARMPHNIVLVGVTATLQGGGQMERVTHFLGFEPGRFFSLHRSNIRQDLQLQFRTLMHGLSGSEFPDLDIVLTEGRKCIIFCDSIMIGFQLLCYFWRTSSPYPPQSTCFHLYNAVNWQSHNHESRELMRSNPLTQIIIATNVLHVGVSLGGIQDAYILGKAGVDPNKFMQMTGRAGRESSIIDGRGIIYIGKGAKAKAWKMGASGGSLQKKTANGKKEMNGDMARTLVATYAVEELNCIFDNPPPSSCSCTTCGTIPSIPPTPAGTCTLYSSCNPHFLLKMAKRAQTKTKPFALTGSLCPMEIPLAGDACEVVQEALEAF